MNWIEELYRPWWDANGAAIEAPRAPIRAPNRWVNDIYKPWREQQPVDSIAPAVPW